MDRGRGDIMIIIVWPVMRVLEEAFKIRHVVFMHLDRLGGCHGSLGGFNGGRVCGWGFGGRGGLCRLFKEPGGRSLWWWTLWRRRSAGMWLTRGETVGKASVCGE